MKWNSKAIRVYLAIAAVASLLLSILAGEKWA